ncbi:tRNA3(Ser)-specific nuclease (plasmid) [Hartmannibacter diazotrophicus]|uniref:tRNA3(Ser)-specific nuclease n=1 Tax=Hartmannibacter diazotrophicus TaxID=1482074 RepID=A0A2C9DEG1_9HYPH|nr:tRNA3(Ser)-specific nuclease [Hartmannibacter diazotrophicus]
MFVRLAQLISKLSILVAILSLSSGATSAQSQVLYTYDDLGRLISALYDNSVCVVYSYDANGNRTAQTNSVSGAPSTPTWGTGVLGCFRWTP